MSRKRAYHYPHRISKAERAAMDVFYSPDGLEKHNAFSHTAQCDEFASASAMLNEADEAREVLGESVASLLPGGEVAHEGCTCWCHQADVDKDQPPDFIENTLADEVETELNFLEFVP